MEKIAIKNKSLFPKVIFSKKWLPLEKCEFGTLAAILYLAEDGTTFKGKISDICKFVRISPQTKNANKRKQCIEELSKKGIVSYEVEKKTYTVKIIDEIGEEDRIAIEKREILVAMNCKLEGKSVAWEKVLKTWVFLAGNRKEIITTKEISAAINEKTWSIYHAKAILECAGRIDCETKYNVTECEMVKCFFIVLDRK